MILFEEGRAPYAVGTAVADYAYSGDTRELMVQSYLEGRRAGVEAAALSVISDIAKYRDKLASGSAAPRELVLCDRLVDHFQDELNRFMTQKGVENSDR